MVVRAVVDDARHLDAVETRNDANRSLDSYSGQLVVQDERITLPPGTDQLSRRGLAPGAKRVQVANVRIVLEHE